MRTLISLLLVVVAAAALFTPATAAASTEVTVEVRNTGFRPNQLEISAGDTVTWRVVDGGHTITSDDRLEADFDFPGGTGTTVKTGEAYSFSFSEPGVYTFHCRLHGTPGGFPNGMTGAIYVDVPVEEPPQPEVRRVPTDYPTIADALRLIPEGSVVAVEAGTYSIDEPIELTTDGVVLRRAGEGEGEVVLKPAANGGPDHAIVVSATGVAVEGISVRGFEWAGISVDTATAFRVDDVSVTGGEYGIHVRWADGGGINRSSVSDTTRAGIRIESCLDLSCPHIVGGRVTGRGSGIELVRTGLSVIENVEVDVGGTGISLVAPSGALVEGNTISRAAVGVSVTGPSTNVSVRENVVSAPVALSWDLLGYRVCFSDNTDASGSEPVTQPPALQTLAACSR